MSKGFLMTKTICDTCDNYEIKIDGTDHRCIAHLFQNKLTKEYFEHRASGNAPSCKCYKNLGDGMQRHKSIKDAHGDYLEIEESYEYVFLDITSKDMQNTTLNTVRFKKEDLKQIIEFLQELEIPTDGAQ